MDKKKTAKKLPSLRVYFSDPETIKRIEKIADAVGISSSSVASMAMKNGLPKVEELLLNVADTSKPAKPKK